MCNASNYALGAVLAQKIVKLPRVIYYASKTLDAAQANYTTTENELLAIYENSKFYKEKTKKFHDSLIAKKDFVRNGFSRCPLTLKLLSVDSLLILTVP